MKDKVSIVIPNWNGIHLLRKYLKDVVSTSEGAEIIITDDASIDGSVEYIQKTFPEVKIVTSRQRSGFATNVNRGARIATGDIIILLNTDVLPQKGYIQPLVACFSDSDVFAVGCLEKSEENGKVVLRGRGLAHWEKGFYIHSRGEINKKDTAWVSGGSGAFRRSMWDKLGGMDELFSPFYWEDIDLSYRARKAGWKTLFEPKSVVHHYHEKGKIQSEFSADDVKKIAYRNQFIFIWKNISDKDVILAHLIWSPIRLLQAFFRKDTFLINGYMKALGKIYGIMKYRENHHEYNHSDKDLNLWD